MRATIENTKAFTDLEGFKQNIWRKKDNIKKISNELIKARTLGYEEWKSTTKPCSVIDSIVKEILNTAP